MPTLLDVARCWLALDMEGVDRPAGVAAADLKGCAYQAIRRLPEAFQGAECIAQATASHGIKPGCRVRLWYWLTRTATGRELTRWLRHTPADPSVFRAAQPIYTAAPMFAPGTVDHLPQRLMVLPGTKLVALPPLEIIAPTKRAPVRPLPAAGAAGAARYAFAALTNAAVRIRQAQLDQGTLQADRIRRDGVIQAVRRLVHLVEGGRRGLGLAEALQSGFGGQRVCEGSQARAHTGHAVPAEGASTARRGGVIRLAKPRVQTP
jgi:hypothetical protein